MFIFILCVFITLITLKLKLVYICRENMSYITNNEIEKYVYNILPDSPSILKELEKTAKSRNVPIVGPMIGRLLYIFASVSNAKHILEIGTAIGYSAIWLGLAVKRNKGRVKTIEIDRDIANEAIKNIRRAGLAKIVEVINGNALKILPKINDKFEKIFIDDSKKNYPKYINLCMKLLHKNGLLIADNALWRGEVALESKSENADSIARFNELLMRRMHSLIIPARDGVAIGIK